MAHGEHVRVWDSFLTESDRQLLRQEPTLRRGIGSTPALVMVDLYNRAFESRRRDDGSASAPDVAGGSELRTVSLHAIDALPALERLLDLARKAGIPIAHIKGLTTVPRWSDLSKGTRATTDVASDSRRHAYDIIAELAPREGELVVEKAGPSAFGGTPLVALFNRLNVDSIIVAGGSASGCVRATVSDAAGLQYRIVVVEDCVYDRYEAPRALSLFDIDRKYGDVISVDEVGPLILSNESAGGEASSR